MYRMFIRTWASAAEAQGKKLPVSVFGLEGRYVSALYSAASQLNQLDQVEKSLRDLQGQLKKPKIVDFLETSLIKRADKAKLLMDIGNKTGMPTAAINFLGVVAENGRLKYLRRIINTFLTVMVAHRNEAHCEVITAEALDDSTRNALMEALKKFVKQGQNIQLKEIVDPSVIGGMIVGIEDKHIDMSISRKVHMYTAMLKQAV